MHGKFQTDWWVMTIYGPNFISGKANEKSCYANFCFFLYFLPFRFCQVINKRSIFACCLFYQLSLERYKKQYRLRWTKQQTRTHQHSGQRANFQFSFVCKRCSYLFFFGRNENNLFTTEFINYRKVKSCRHTHTNTINWPRPPTNRMDDNTINSNHFDFILSRKYSSSSISFSSIAYVYRSIKSNFLFSAFNWMKNVEPRTKQKSTIGVNKKNMHKCQVSATGTFQIGSHTSPIVIMNHAINRKYSCLGHILAHVLPTNNNDFDVDISITSVSMSIRFCRYIDCLFRIIYKNGPHTRTGHCYLKQIMNIDEQTRPKNERKVLGRVNMEDHFEQWKSLHRD